jgi:hypothetical protein
MRRTILFATSCWSLATCCSRASLGNFCAIVALTLCVPTTARAEAQPIGAESSIPDTTANKQGPTAERPMWKVGYMWKYHQVGGSPAVESDWSREVNKSLPAGQFSILTETGKELVFDGETNSLDPRGPDYSWKRFSFPLFVGKEWTHKRHFGNAAYDGYETSSWEVKGYEKMTVPAGTYDCFRVEGVVWGTLAIPPYGPQTSHETVMYWYCPTIEWFARFKSHRRKDQYSSYIDSESVLTSFSENR